MKAELTTDRDTYMTTKQQQRYDACIAGLHADGVPDQRTANVLANLGYGSKAQVKAAVAQGRLKLSPSPRNYGMKSHCRVCDWVGLPYDLNSIRVLVCPHCSKEVQF